MASSQSVWSGDVEWYRRSPNNPRYRPFGAFAGCKPATLPRELTKEEKEYQAEEERLAEEVWQKYMVRRPPPPPEETEKPAEKEIKVRQESALAVLRRETGAQIRETRDQVTGWYRRVAFAIDGKMYWAGRWYREKSIFPELWYVLGCVLKAAIVLAVLAWFVKGRVDAWRAERDVFVYSHVPLYHGWSVSQPRCGCDAD
ncbi:hypothetical protein GGR53DRAFT_464958 [Hypoxylon sp. FL1150]|nr:hypothetical protein GGR53DRAFT_464958 [Hypoxylon sp. FL1150]